MSDLTRSRIVEAARSFIGTPYKAGGQDRRGLSCAGLLVAIGKETGYLKDAVPGFSSFSEAESMQKWFGLYLDPVASFEEAQEGDVIATIGPPESPQHCGVVVNKSPRGLKYSYVVHCLMNHGCVEGRLFGSYLAQVSGFYRLRGLVDE